MTRRETIVATPVVVYKVNKMANATTRLRGAWPIE